MFSGRKERGQSQCADHGERLPFDLRLPPLALDPSHFL